MTLGFCLLGVMVIFLLVKQSITDNALIRLQYEISKMSENFTKNVD